MLKNRIAYAFMLFTTIAFIFANGSAMAYASFYAVVIMPVLTFLAAFLSSKSILAEHRLDKNGVVKNEEFNLIVEVKNASFLPVTAVKVKASAKAGIFNLQSLPNAVFTLMPQKRQTVNFTFCPLCRGSHKIGEGKIEVLDLLGIFVFKKNIDENLDILVYPHIVEIDNPIIRNIAASNVFFRHEKQNEDYSSISDLRKYNPEDSQKKIHWKASAKKNELIVKNYNSLAQNHCVLILDCTDEVYKRFSHSQALSLQDNLVTGVVSFGRYCLMRRYPIDFFYSSDLVLKHSESDYSGFSGFYNLCAIVEFKSGIGINGLLDSVLHTENDFTNIVLFSAELSSQTSERLRSAAAFGHRAVFVYPNDSLVTSQRDFAEQLSILAAEGILCMPV